MEERNYFKEWYIKNRDKILEKNKEYREKNKDYYVEYRNLRKEYYKNYHKEYQKTRGDYFREYYLKNKNKLVKMKTDSSEFELDISF